MHSLNKIKDDNLKAKLEHEKALFDFDQDIDDLEEVEERYPAQLSIASPPEQHT